MSCFVPHCDSTSGVPFPTDIAAKTRWLESLNLSNSPPRESFVCLDHFDPSDLDENCDVVLELFDRIKSGAVPTLIKGNETNLCGGNRKKEEYAQAICRVCNTNKRLEKSLSDSFEGETSVMSAIMLCCYPVKIAKDDSLPQFICYDCLNELKFCYEFRLKCLETDERWCQKRKAEDDSDVSEKRIRKDIDEAVDLEYLKMPSIDEKSNVVLNLSGSEPPPLILFDQPKTTIQVKESERNIEKIHGISKSSVSSSSARQVINMKAKQNNSKKLAKAQQTCKVKNTIKIPQGITVTPSSDSSIGTFPCTLTYGFQGNVFVSSNGYLFTYSLRKANTRYLCCILPNCKARAEQVILEDESYSDFITVKVHHNHRVPSEQVRKKQMFFYVMRKRMQLDKMLNIKNIYEEICNLEPEIRTLIPLKNVINEICQYQVFNRMPKLSSFEDFYDKIEDDVFEKLHFTNSGCQFYQEKFADDDGSLAVVFCNMEIVEQISDSNIMYVDASFKIDTDEDFNYQLVTALVWIDNSYYPILFALVNKKTREIFKNIFTHLHDVLAPNLRPHEIVTDYEACLYYALGEVYLDSHIGGSVFYYTQNLYKKVCSLNLSRELEVNSNFKNIYHMLLMLPLLPVNTISDGLNNIEIQARDAGLSELVQPIFDYIKTQWILEVTPELFCVHRLENRINENVIAPFKKLRDFLLLFKGKISQSHITITQVIEKLIELESFLQSMYTKLEKKASFGRDLSSFQKKNVVRAWQFIESHPKININNLFQKVLGYIKCMENQLWIWGFYRYVGDTDEVLISASNFATVPGEDGGTEEDNIAFVEMFLDDDTPMDEVEVGDPAVVMEAVIDNDGEVVLQTDVSSDQKQFEKEFLKHVEYE